LSLSHRGTASRRYYRFPFAYKEKTEADQSNSGAKKKITSNGPPGVNDGALLPSDIFIIPVPGFWVDRFADTPENAEAAEFVVLDMVRAVPAEQTDGRRGGVKMSELVFVDRLPVARGRGIHRRRFKDSCRDAIAKGPVDDIAVGW
jgi:hypothetical protein